MQVCEFRKHQSKSMIFDVGLFVKFYWWATIQKDILIVERADTRMHIAHTCAFAHMYVSLGTQAFTVNQYHLYDKESL